MRGPLLLLMIGMVMEIGFLAATGGMLEKPVEEGPAGSENAVVPPAPKSIWSIGIYSGPSPFELSDLAQVGNPVITPEVVTDIKASVVAHPFVVKKGPSHFMFFTAKNSLNDEGEIGLAESEDGLHWSYRQIVLDAPYHLAYPFVFEWRGDYYMIPEGVADRSVRLFRAAAFPTQWTLQKVLLEGKEFISASVVRYRDNWWMFVGLEGNETLLLYYARELEGPWIEHSASPVVAKDKNIARPGGRPLVVEGRLYRLGQDCYPNYGEKVLAFEVTEISPTTYREREVVVPLVRATGAGWNSEGMHHLDAWSTGRGSWLAAVDGVQIIR